MQDIASAIATSVSISDVGASKQGRDESSMFSKKSTISNSSKVSTKSDASKATVKSTSSKQSVASMSSCKSVKKVVREADMAAPPSKIEEEGANTDEVV